MQIRELTRREKGNLASNGYGELEIGSCAFPVDDGGTVLLVVLLGDPAGVECAEGCEGGTSLPDSVFTVSGGDDTDLSTGRSASDKLFLEPIGDALVHG